MKSSASFEVCKLCTQLALDSVEVDADLRLFLLHCLQIENERLPNRVCPDCHEACTRSMDQRNKWLRAVAKIECSNLNAEAILGLNTADDLRRIENFHAVSRRRVNRGHRRSRVVVNQKERLLAELAINNDGFMLVSGDLEGSNQVSHHENVEFEATGANGDMNGPLETTLKLPKSKTSGPKMPSNNSVVPDPSSSIMAQSVSSFGRVRKPKNHDGFLVLADEYEARKERQASKEKSDDFDEEQSVAKMRKSKPKPASKRKMENNEPIPALPNAANAVSTEDDPLATPVMEPVNDSIENLQPEEAPNLDSSSDLKRSRPPKNFYYMDDDGPMPPSSSKNQKVEETNGVSVDNVVVDDDEDLTEVFPSVGPFQCEICQTITDAKRDFVEHIKQAHRQVIDEDVLKSLEDDLRKAAKKEAKAKARITNSEPKRAANSKKSTLKTPKSKKGHTCDHCNVTLTTAGSLRRHMNSVSCQRNKAKSLETKNVGKEENLNPDDIVLDKRSSFKTKSSLAQKYQNENAELSSLADDIKNAQMTLDEALLPEPVSVNADPTDMKQLEQNVVVEGIQPNPMPVALDENFLANPHGNVQAVIDMSNMFA